MTLSRLHKSVAAIVFFVLLAFSGYFWLTDTFATEEKVNAQKEQFNIHLAEYVWDKVQDEITHVEKRIGVIEDRFGCYGPTECLSPNALPPTVKEEYRAKIKRLGDLKSVKQ